MPVDIKMESHTWKVRVDMHKISLQGLTVSAIMAEITLHGHKEVKDSYTYVCTSYSIAIRANLTITFDCMY